LLVVVAALAVAGVAASLHPDQVTVSVADKMLAKDVHCQIRNALHCLVLMQGDKQSLTKQT
jgi:hypothetical protein